jgi:energy-coupling factor transporter ATP-binding protein EcfA2
VVRQSLAQLNVTRVVIAQRLTTVMNADRIYVLDAGHVVETGNYQTSWPPTASSPPWPAASSPRLLRPPRRIHQGARGVTASRTTASWIR